MFVYNQRRRHQPPVMKKWWILLLFFAFAQASEAQFSRHVIILKDKTGTPFTLQSPAAFLSPRSLARRNRYTIAIDQTDLPVNPAYIDSIRLAGNVTILSISKWLNQVCILTTDTAAFNRINRFTFVAASMPVAARQQSLQSPAKKWMDTPLLPLPTLPAMAQLTTGLYNYGAAAPQADLHQVSFLHNLGFSGQGMQLAVMDAGFFKYNTLPTFDSVRINNQILGTWDFVANEERVDEDNAHGMYCFSTMAANLPGSFVGTVPKASFYLYRTEDVSSEYPIEEHFWVAAAEKADSLGVDVFSVSLGYNYFDNPIFNYTYAQLDGNKAALSRAADLAAKKGILVVAAVGNEGAANWKYLTVPADADSILAVGAVNANRQVAAFSSYGPSADGQVKPDVAALGENAVIANAINGAPTYSNGTSFACPVMAGIVTCLWQAFPEVNNMTIIEQLRRSSDRFTTPDNRTGYGIPDAKKAFVSLIKHLYAGRFTIENDCSTRLSFSVKAGDGMEMVLERKLPAASEYVLVTSRKFTGSFTTRTIDFTDDLAAFTTAMDVNYRLKMIIGSDTAFYVDSAVISYAANCNTTSTITLGPNPTGSSTHLNLMIARQHPAAAAITLHNMSGQLVYTLHRVIPGTSNLSIPIAQLRNGVYLITVYIDQQKSLVKKIVRE